MRTYDPALFFLIASFSGFAWGQASNASAWRTDAVVQTTLGALRGQPDRFSTGR